MAEGSCSTWQNIIKSQQLHLTMKLFTSLPMLMTRCFSTAALARQNQHDSESKQKFLCDILQYTKFVSVKTQLYLDNRVYVFESGTHFNLAYIILRLTTIL